MCLPRRNSPLREVDVRHNLSVKKNMEAGSMRRATLADFSLPLRYRRFMAGHVNVRKSRKRWE